MAIQVRRGNEADFDASKMLPGEWAVSLDTKYVRMCFAPGIVLRMATYEGFEADKAQFQAILAECRSIQEVVRRIGNEVSEKASLTIEYSNSAKKDAERAKLYADKAEAVTGVNIATQDRAGLVKGGDNYIAEDGTLMLITTTTSPTMQNSYDGRLKIDSIEGGESKQNSTAGNQLFDGILEQGAYNGAGGKTTSNYRVRCANSIAINPNETYTISCKGANDIAIFESDGSGNTSVLTSFASLPLTFTTSSNGATIVFALRIDDTTAITPSTVSEVMLNKGTTALPYEPYTGGIPSPNPSYPQEIKKTVVSEIRTHGKNFLKNTHEKETTTNGLTFITNDDGTVTINGTATADTNYNISADYISMQDGLYMNLIQLSGTFNGDIVHTAFDSSYAGGKNTPIGTSRLLKETIKYIRFRMTISSGTVCNNLVVGFMVSKDADATYEPYTESVITLSQPIELYGIGDVKDVIEGGKVKRRFGKVVLNGSESWGTSTSFGGRYYTNNLGCGVRDNVLCSQASIAPTHNTEIVNTCYLRETSGGRFVINTEFATVEEWKAHLASNPMTVVYELATETTEELPIADQIALNSIKTYDGITYLEFDSEIEPTFKGEYGTSKVGGYTLEGMLAGRNGELLAKSNSERINALEASVVNNI